MQTTAAFWLRIAAYPKSVCFNTICSAAAAIASATGCAGGAETTVICEVEDKKSKQRTRVPSVTVTILP